MTHFIALCTIRRQPKQGPLTEMTGYDPDGNAIVRATSEIIKPGQFFTEADPAEAAWFIKNDAAREATARELEVYNQMGSK